MPAGPWVTPSKTSIASLGLGVGQSFGYWFDLWDDWHHEIKVVAIGDAEPGVRYPRVVSSVSENPPPHLSLLE